MMAINQNFLYLLIAIAILVVLLLMTVILHLLRKNKQANLVRREPVLGEKFVLHEARVIEEDEPFVGEVRVREISVEEIVEEIVEEDDEEEEETEGYEEEDEDESEENEDEDEEDEEESDEDEEYEEDEEDEYEDEECEECDEEDEEDEEGEGGEGEDEDDEEGESEDEDDEEEDIIAVYLLAEKGQPYTGYELLQALLSVGFRYGARNIFHWHVDNLDEESPVLFSLAQAVAPGNFDLEEMGAVVCPGLVLFIDSDVTEHGDEVLDKMLQVAEDLVEDLGGEICDIDQDPISDELIDKWKERLQDVDSDDE